MARGCRLLSTNHLSSITITSTSPESSCRQTLPCLTRHMADDNTVRCGRERKTRILNFRIPPTVEAQIAHYIDPANGANSADKAARKILIEALAGREEQRRRTHFNLDKISNWEILTGDAESVLSALPPRICRTCVCSPPYYRQ